MRIKRILFAGCLLFGCSKGTHAPPSHTPGERSQSAPAATDMDEPLSSLDAPRESFVPIMDSHCVPEEVQRGVLRSDGADVLRLPETGERDEPWHQCERTYAAELNEGADVERAAYHSVICHAKLYAAYHQEKYRDAPHRKPGNCVHVRCAGLTGAEKKACTGEDKTEKEKLAPIEIEAPRLRESAAYRRYLYLVTDSENRANIAYRLARVYYEANRFGEASVLFKYIAIRYPAELFAVYSVDQYLDCIWAMGIVHDETKSACEEDATAFLAPLLTADSVLGNGIREENLYLFERIETLLSGEQSY